MESRHAHSHAHRQSSLVRETAQEHDAHRVQAPSSHAERAATWLSLACAVHCLLMPMAISLMPLLGASGVTHFGPTAELVMTLLVVASALAGVVWGYRRHRDLRFVVATVGGLLAYLLGHAFHDSWYGMALAVLGGLTLAASSFLGARLSHSCADPTCAS